jgi:CheY-like chemotaxis protein
MQHAQQHGQFDQAQRILVADDCEPNRALLRRLLTRCGYEVVEVCDGCETLKAVEQELPDLLLLDLRMPELDGDEALRHLRRRYDQTQLPIIIVTAEHDANIAADCVEAGANDYITKPFIAALLRARIKTFLTNRAANERPAQH